MWSNREASLDRHGEETQTYLAALIELAERLSRLRELSGRTEPTVIT